MYSDQDIRNQEIRNLIELMPASGRMKVKLISKPEQSQVIVARFPRPWEMSRPITINFDLWSQLSRGQRDMLLLRAVSWVTTVRLLKPDIYQAMAAAGTIGVLVELVQFDTIGMAMAGGLTAIAGTQIWRNSRSPKAELEADEGAIRVALRRGYTEVEAGRQLLAAIEAVARIEERPLSFTELLRYQNLKAIAGLSPVEVPDKMRQGSI